MNRKIIRTLLYTLLALPLTVAQSEENKTIKGRFRFAFVTINPEGRAAEIKEDTPVGLPDDPQLFIQPLKNVYIYLFYLDSRNDITLIFPASAGELGKQDGRNDKYYFPETGNVSGFFKKPGTYKLILVASTTRQRELEDIFTVYFKSSIKQDKMRKQCLLVVKKVLAESLLDTLVSTKSIQYIGTIRTEEEGIVDEEAKEYTFTGVYSKTYIIEYKKK